MLIYTGNGHYVDDYGDLSLDDLADRGWECRFIRSGEVGEDARFHLGHWHIERNREWGIDRRASHIWGLFDHLKKMQSQLHGHDMSRITVFQTRGQDIV